MRWFPAFAIFLTLCLDGTGSSHARAQEILPQPGQFSHPNETQPGELLGILHQAPAGAYVAVGTERGFISAPLSPRFSALVLADIDPGIVFQNRLNLALIQMSGGNRQEYLRLRMHASESDWLTAAKKAHLPKDLLSVVKNPDSWRWWSENIRRSPKFASFHTPPGPANPEFRDANYLFSDAQFARIYRMAANGNIAILEADLTQNADVKRIVKELSKRGISLSVLDISNVAEPVRENLRDDVAGKKKVDEMLAGLAREFSPVAEDKSLLVETHREIAVQGPKISWKDWIYDGYPLSDLNNPRKRAHVLELMEDEPSSSGDRGLCVARRLENLIFFSSK